jgi:hypothetical protein
MKNKLLIFIVAYNAETTIINVLQRIPKKLFAKYDTEILIIDDSSPSPDKTFEKAIKYKTTFDQCKLNIIKNPNNLGYGGNQKKGYQYAIKNNFDYVALLHGDGQYAPELLPILLNNFKNKTGAVFGSRMIKKKSAIRGGMPLYKFFGNIILSTIQNKILGTNFSEFHSGYRIYKVECLKKIPFNLNTNDFHFDTEIIIQFILSNFIIKEIPIPTYYGDEICRVNGIKYALNVIKSTCDASLMHFGILYKKKFDLKNNAEKYQLKLKFESSHSKAFNLINKKSVILDLGAGNNSISEELVKKKKCKIYACDISKLKNKNNFFTKFKLCDLDKNRIPFKGMQFDYILLLDVIEHLKSPELFMDKLYNYLAVNSSLSKETNIIISTPNIGFFVTRFNLLFGNFNYGNRGILDMTHCRLFTNKTFTNIIKDSNFRILKNVNIIAPYSLVIKNKTSLFILNNLNKFFIKLFPNMFAYQFLKVISLKNFKN